MKKAEVLRDYAVNNKLNEETAYSILSRELNKRPKLNKSTSFK